MSLSSNYDAAHQAEPSIFDGSGTDPPDADAFFASGEQDVRTFLAQIGYEPTGRDRLLEVGCGAGRMTRAFATRFGSVSAVDTSPELINVADKYLAGFPNVQLSLLNGIDLREFSDDSFDFCFWYPAVPQTPNPRSYLRYLREMGRVLAPGGRAYFQLHTLRLPPLRNLRTERLRLVGFSRLGTDDTWVRAKRKD
jgi:ubiquinone/menaquinone biosynthesis C-methylase UbiE